MNGTTYYDHSRDAVLARYNVLHPDEVHAGWAPAHLPSEPGFACDIGAGSGRDSNWLAANSWEVVAVEPSTLRDRAARDSHQRVVWMNDALPDLRNLRALGRRFDLILLSAVWMQVVPKGLEPALRILSELLGPVRPVGDHAARRRGCRPQIPRHLGGRVNRLCQPPRHRASQPHHRARRETPQPQVGNARLGHAGRRHRQPAVAAPRDHQRQQIVHLQAGAAADPGAPRRNGARAGHRAHGRLRGHSIRGRRPVLVETVPAPGVAPPPAVAPVGTGRLWLGEGSVPPAGGRLAFRPLARRRPTA